MMKSEYKKILKYNGMFLRIVARGLTRSRLQTNKGRNIIYSNVFVEKLISIQ